MGLFKRKIPSIDISIKAEMPHKFHSKVAGASHYQDAIKKCKKKEKLKLVREPDNPYDSNAISVWNKAGMQIGHLKKEVAAEIAPVLDNGTWVNVEVSEITGGTADKPTRGCNIHISWAD